MPPDHADAFAPGRVNLIGEHTDYNDGLAMPFAIAEGVLVHAERRRDGHVRACAADLGEEDVFAIDDIAAADGWPAFVRGTVAELRRAGVEVGATSLEIAGDVPLGVGLSSSAAVGVALCLALLAIADASERARDPIGVARLCARVEHDWVGAQTGLLDQLASLCGQPDAALLIDFQSLQMVTVPLALDGWRLLLLDSGERHAHASSQYNLRRRECARAGELLGVKSLRAADPDAVERLPEPLRSRAQHVSSENQRVQDAAAALRAGDLIELGALLNESHASLRDRFDASTPAVEATVQRMRAAGAAGARMVGGGFGGYVLGLFGPEARAPSDAREVRPAGGARLL